MVEGILCNQGCGTHVYLTKRGPYNILDKKKHDCPMLHMAKLWGGRYNTIPMGIIKKGILESYSFVKTANGSKNIDDILKALRVTMDNLQYVVYQLEAQEEKNTEWSNQLEGYKRQLVKEQTLREKKRRFKNDAKKGIVFTTADKLQSRDDSKE